MIETQPLFLFRYVLLLSFLCAVGCATAPRRAAPAFSTEPWTWRELTGRTLRSPRYVIHTTLEDPHDDMRLVSTLETAFSQYASIVPGRVLDAKAMECFLFANRAQWARFTAATAGPTSRVYLQVDRGGYTQRDRFVAYDLGERGTAAVIAHEGFHQFVYRNFKSRPPPFIEEGVATLFETATAMGPAPRLGRVQHAARVQRLAEAQAAGTLWPLAEAITLHAGDVIVYPPARVDTFYAQGWALAHFLLDDSRYEPAFRKLLLDTARDIAPAGVATTSGAWTPSDATQYIERGLGVDLAVLESDYRAYIAALVRRAE